MILYEIYNSGYDTTYTIKFYLGNLESESKIKEECKNLEIEQERINKRYNELLELFENINNDDEWDKKYREEFYSVLVHHSCDYCFNYRKIDLDLIDKI